MKNTPHLVTDWGAFPVPKSIAIIMASTKPRKNGEPDRRTAAARFLDVWEAAAHRSVDVAMRSGDKVRLPEADEVSCP